MSRKRSRVNIFHERVNVTYVLSRVVEGSSRVEHRITSKVEYFGDVKWNPGRALNTGFNFLSKN